MDFQERLKKAIDRGRRRSAAESEKARAKELSEQELKQRHSAHRLKLSEHIERCLGQLAHQFPGFRCETIYGERGWGAACFRDDLDASSRKRVNVYSRLEMTIKPLSAYPILELACKGTIRNKEVFTRSHYDDIENVSEEEFEELIDLWIVEFAELYAAQQ